MPDQYRRGFSSGADVSGDAALPAPGNSQVGMNAVPVTGTVADCRGNLAAPVALHNNSDIRNDPDWLRRVFGDDGLLEMIIFVSN